MARVKFAFPKKKTGASQPAQQRNVDMGDSSLSSPVKSMKSIKHFEQDMESYDVVDEETRILYESILYGTKTINHHAVADATGLNVEIVRMRHILLMEKIAASLSASRAAEQTDKDSEEDLDKGSDKDSRKDSE